MCTKYAVYVLRLLEWPALLLASNVIVRKLTPTAESQIFTVPRQ